VIVRRGFGQSDSDPNHAHEFVLNTMRKVLSSGINLLRSAVTGDTKPWKFSPPQREVGLALFTNLFPLPPIDPNKRFSSSQKKTCWYHIRQRINLKRRKSNLVLPIISESHSRTRDPLPSQAECFQLYLSEKRVSKIRKRCRTRSVKQVQRSKEYHELMILDTPIRDYLLLPWKSTQKTNPNRMFTDGGRIYVISKLVREHSFKRNNKLCFLRKDFDKLKMVRDTFNRAELYETIGYSLDLPSSSYGYSDLERKPLTKTQLRNHQRRRK
jgi:hypothetical protein